MDNKSNKTTIIITASLLLCLLLAIFYFMPIQSVWIALGLAAAVIAYLLISRLVKKGYSREENQKRWHNVFSLLSVFAIMFLVFVALFYYAVPSILTIVLMVSLMFTLVVNFITVPIAVIHKFKEEKTMLTPLSYYPKVSIIVPAYNEEKVLARTIETLIETDYPDKEIIVVDDGSKDNTYKVAQSFRLQGVKAIQRPNGGKFAALNTGLVYATGEIIVTVDADSLVTRAALREVVRSFIDDPDVGGVAGNLKVLNRNKFIAKLQALEYIFQIQIVRRAFENFGTVTVAPGAFSAFRRKDLEEVGNYDPDPLLEDFDLTIKLMKSHKVLQGNPEALCYTEAPETMGDVYKQRLSWYRGDFVNFWKHRDAFFNPRFGFMHQLTLPYMLISMTFIPLASIIILITSIMMLLNGEGMTLVYAFGFFVVLQFLASILAIQIAEDDMKLAVYSPLYIVGYKQFLDFVMLKALFDVIIGRGKYATRERVTRIGNNDEVKTLH